MTGFWRGLGERLRFVSSPQATFSDTNPLRLFNALRERRQGDAIDRESALSVPAVLRGRNLICSISTLPLVQYAPDNRKARSSLLDQIDPDVPNVVMLAQTVEDLLFDSIAWWKVTATDFNNFPIAARRCEPGSVSITPPGGKGRTPAPLPSGIDPRFGVLYVDGKAVSARGYIRFDSPNPGLLEAGCRAVRRALLLDETAALYADNPRPLDYLTPAGGGPSDMSDEDINAKLDEWDAYRKKRSTAWLEGAEYNTVDSPTPASLQLVELIKQAALEIANALGLDPEDLGISTTSRTYQNAVDRRKDRINDTLSPYMRAITDRLSMGDITRRGYRVAFDLDDYLRADPLTRAQVDEIRIRSGVIVPSEAREEEGLPAMTSAQLRELEGTQRAAQPARDAIRAHATIGPLGLEMAGPPVTMALDVPAQAFAVNREERTISALLVPYGETAVHNGRRFRFDVGSLEFADVSRVKLLRDHDRSQAIGRAIRIEETPAGPVGTFKVARGAAGDEVLSLVEDGVLDGVSVGVDFSADDITADTLNKATTLVRRADLREVSLTAMPAFDNSRVTAVAASRTEGDTVPETIEPTPALAAPADAPGAVTLSADQFAALLARSAPVPAVEQPAEEPAIVNPTRQTAATFVAESLPYRFSHQGGRHVFRNDADHDFSTDLIAILKAQQTHADFTAPLARVNGLISAAFADVETADVTALNPNRHRPDMWQPQMDYATPLWDMVNSGPIDGTKFDIPKFTSSAGLVGPATEKVEPASGSLVVELQTITPTQVWGKAEITRQAWRNGGSPQMSGILWDQMLREYYEDREAAVATFLATLTAATDITLPGVDASPDNTERLSNAQALEAAIASLQFVRGGNRFRAFAVHEALYRLLAQTTDTTGRPLYPQTNPTNANGTASNLFSTLNIAGTTAVPSYALGAAGGNAAVNSWLFDPAKVRGWASAPERLEWNFGATVQTANIPQLSFVTVGIYGDVAFGNTDINGVRQVVFDQNTAA